MLQKFYGWYGKRTVNIIIGVIVLLVAFIVIKFSGTPEVVTVEEPQLPVVEVSSSNALQSSNSLEVIGQVAAKTQAKLQAEAGGRIVSVNVALGQTIAPGTVIAQLENASQRASLLQAEGSYEATLAQSAQTDIGLTEAENNLDSSVDSANTANQSAFTTITDILYNNIDKLYSSPNEGNIGLRISGRGQTEFLNSERIAFRDIITNWDDRKAQSGDTETAIDRLQISKRQATRLLGIVDTFIPLLNESSNTSGFSEAEVAAIANSMTTSRERLIALIASLEASEKSIVDNIDAVAKAKLSASGGTTSASDAQIKQALGSLRAAQANYQKTIVRSPIAGTVNQLSVRAGDYVSQGAPVAEIANNSGLEVTTYLDDTESRKLTVGSVVTLGDSATGTVTNISPAVDSATGKIEVRIGVNQGDLKVGNTVKVTSMSEVSADNLEIIIPLSAIKLGTNDAYIFVVNQENKLETKSVVLGPVSGEMVVVRSGIDLNTEIVLDARGLKAGEEVTVAK